MTGNNSSVIPEETKSESFKFQFECKENFYLFATLFIASVPNKLISSAKAVMSSGDRKNGYDLNIKLDEKDKK